MQFCRLIHVLSGPRSVHGIFDSREAGDGIETGHVYVNMHSRNNEAEAASSYKKTDYVLKCQRWQELNRIRGMFSVSLQQGK